MTDTLAAQTAPAEPIVHGDAEHGFIVEQNDASGNRVHACEAKSPDEAISQARKAWSDKDREAAKSEGDETKDGDSKPADAGPDLSALKKRVAELEAKSDVYDAKFTAIEKAFDEMPDHKKLTEAVSEAEHTHADEPKPAPSPTPPPAVPPGPS